MKSMQNNKAPGPDGYPVEFFQRFQHKLAPLLHSVYIESLQNGSLPPTFRQASISLLLKKDKDPKLCSSYRPLSLINVDAKILAKALDHLSTIVSEEQTVFIKGCQLFYNVRILLNIIYSKSTTTVPELVISVDAEKVFDRVEWDLLAVLNKFGMGTLFNSWIRLLYTAPQASITTSGIQSSFFTLSHGTRQGCPLSPLLFALAIEPLSIYLRSSPIFTGISRSDMVFKLSPYADDLLLYVSDPDRSIPAILSYLKTFGSLTGYKVNISKTECYPINASALQLNQANIPFKLCPSGFKYLGINVTRTLKSLFCQLLPPSVQNQI
ncbi:uncharacterized protein LOC118299115 [Scophthalmus maximus]|uniref:uncharacterized protein LOC118299115 n=1 Tax=Scophthalmus maximus TaxID=52904 RepID=UPI001FA85656|nr:uncharacterized protein LOC118299115 [Scophthalmus maximus]